MWRVLVVIVVTESACAPPDLCDGEPIITPTTTPLAHAHNDYEHARPLDDALALGFPSVEADVWLRDGAIAVSHDPFSSSLSR
jgi:hypothetical protein